MKDSEERDTSQYPIENQNQGQHIQKEAQNSNLVDIKSYPHNLIAYIKVKIQQCIIQGGNLVDLEKPPFVIKGSGCLISPNLLLTAAHNIYRKRGQIERIQNLKRKWRDNTYVQQALHEGTPLCEYNVKSQYISKEYQKDKTSDFALLEIVPKNQKDKQLNQKMFPPIVVLSPDSAKQLKYVSIYGYPIPLNKGMPIPSNKVQIGNQNHTTPSSIFMNFQSGSKGIIKKMEEFKIVYQVPTEEGHSGSPIFTQFSGQKIILGVHKGVNKQENYGIPAHKMIMELNEVGFKDYKKPLIYTENTLKLRSNKEEMSKIQILFGIDRGFIDLDILVYTSFDLSKLKKIILSGNKITSIGVQFLLRRNYPNLESLFLTKNKIDKLDNIPKQNWSNIKNISNLSLSNNQLSDLPLQMIQLSKLSGLWLAFNKFTQIPNCLVNFSKMIKQITFIMYENKIDEEKSKDNIEEIRKNQNTQLILYKNPLKQMPK